MILHGTSAQKICIIYYFVFSTLGISEEVNTKHLTRVRPPPLHVKFWHQRRPDQNGSLCCLVRSSRRKKIVPLLLTACVFRERERQRRRKPAIFVCGLIHNVACLRSIKEEREKGVCGRLFFPFSYSITGDLPHELRSIGTEKGKSEKYFLLCTSTFLPAFWTKEFFALKVFCQGFPASIK